MTRNTLRGSATIHADYLAGNFPAMFMALGTVHVAMHPAEHESRPVVIVAYTIPTHGGMTGRAIFRRTAPELAAVRVLRGVTPGAHCGRTFEPGGDLGHSDPIRSGRLVALSAFQILMCPFELGAGGRGVRVWAHLLPLLGGVTGIAGQLSLVRIGVACVAGLGNETILSRHRWRSAVFDRSRRQRQGRAAYGERLVALLAGYGGMPPGEGETRLCVPGN